MLDFAGMIFQSSGTSINRTRSITFRSVGTEVGSNKPGLAWRTSISDDNWSLQNGPDLILLDPAERCLEPMMTRTSGARRVRVESGWSQFSCSARIQAG